MINLNKTLGFGMVVIGGLILTGCQSSNQSLGKMNANFGNSVRQNMAVQIVNPEASKDVTEAPMLDGKKAESAITKYHSDTIKQVEKIETSDVGN
jgi:type IV pilus biogenesis protein CpaD/CtpE